MLLVVLISFKALNKKGVLGEATRSFSLPLTQPETGVSNWYNFMLLMSSETIAANCAVADRSVDVHSCTSVHKGMEERGEFQFNLGEMLEYIFTSGKSLIFKLAHIQQ